MTAEENNLNKIICESCGHEFSCGAQTGSCWCFEINLDPKVLGDLREKYNNCLCPDCLKNKIELSLPRSTPA